jgi:hypothetical protein
VVRRCSACDDVIFRVDDEAFAVVHLTWSGREEREPWGTGPRRHAGPSGTKSTERTLSARHQPPGRGPVTRLRAARRAAHAPPP